MINNLNLVNKSYEVVFIMLVSITFLTSLRSLQNDLTNKERISLQLSTFVTLIASMHYFLMINNKQNIHIYRYFDWFFTTPVLLIDLCILLDIYDFNFILELVGYNSLMLGIGFLGEMEMISITTSTLIGFIPLFVIFARIYNKIKDTKNKEKQRLFYTFFSLWSVYGINHFFYSKVNKTTINGIYNILDLCTKGMFGLYIYNKSWSSLVL